LDVEPRDAAEGAGAGDGGAQQRRRWEGAVGRRCIECGCAGRERNGVK
jgi:hypothetical protein